MNVWNLLKHLKLVQIKMLLKLKLFHINKVINIVTMSKNSIFILILFKINCFIDIYFFYVFVSYKIDNVNG